MHENPADLIARLLIGDLSPSESRHLSELLRTDPELLATYQEQAVMHALLAWHHGSAGQVPTGEIDPLVIAEFLHDAEMAARRQLEEEARERARIAAEAEARRRELERLQQRRVRRPEPIFIPYSVAYLTVAGLAASLIWVAFSLSPAGEPGVTPAVNSSVVQATQPLSILATIIDSVEADFATVTDESLVSPQLQLIPAATGTQLVAGLYQLGHGVVEIEFDNGVTAVLEAPAKIQLISANRVRLARGRIVGRVPPQAIGFSVETPSATIVDLGTEFGISVPDAEGGQAADVMVFNGEVEVVAAAIGRQPTADIQAVERQRLTVDESVRIDSAGSFADSETSSQLYFREVPTSDELARKKAYERWLDYSKKMAADPDVVAYYTFNAQRPSDSRLLNRAGDSQTLHGEIRGAQWGEGRWPYKQSLRFASSYPGDNPSNYVQVDIPGEYSELTLSAWVNIDAFPENRGNLSGLLMTDEWNRQGQLHWQLKGDGRLQAGTYHRANAYEVYSDESILSHEFGNWHHVGLVCSLQTSQMTFYLDGRNVGSREIPTNDSILIGAARIGGWKPSVNGDQGFAQDEFRTLHGRMDELIVLRRAMSDEEVFQLYEAGRP